MLEKLLIVDDTEEIRNQLKWGVGGEYVVLLAKDGNNALALFEKNHPKVVVLDLGLPPHENGVEEGFRCLNEILKFPLRTKVIVITGNDERENAIKAVQSGAYDFYKKPISLDELKVIIRRAFYLYNIEEENNRLHITLEKKAGLASGIMGQCDEMQHVIATLRKVAPSDVSVLIHGESGTGKELVARAIHSMSARSAGAFVAINCGAIPDNLLESELFGHEKGSFTGAHTQVQGKVEYAHKGTLFLDEIGELPGQLQVKLLRFLQDKKIQRIGGREDIAVDARIIAATNKDIIEEIKGDRFREDLYYRIGVITIKLPPLRDRKKDILLLATLFLKRFGEAFKKKAKGFSASSIELLETYAWPGNVRELENRVQRAVILSESSLIEPQDLGFSENPANQNVVHKEGMTLKDAKAKIEREMTISVFDKHKGNIVRIAEELGVSRPTLYDIMKKHGLYNMFNQEGAENRHE